jgi:hypothetical protein
MAYKLSLTTVTRRQRIGESLSGNCVEISSPDGAVADNEVVVGGTTWSEC